MHLDIFTYKSISKWEIQATVTVVPSIMSPPSILSPVFGRANSDTIDDGEYCKLPNCMTTANMYQIWTGIWMKFGDDWIWFFSHFKIYQRLSNWPITEDGYYRCVLPATGQIHNRPPLTPSNFCPSWLTAKLTDLTLNGPFAAIRKMEWTWQWFSTNKTM